MSVPGALVLLAGLTWGLRVVVVLQTTRVLSVGSAMICVLLSILGGQALVTGITLHGVRDLGDWVPRPPLADRDLQSTDRSWPLILLCAPGAVLLVTGIAWGMHVASLLRRGLGLSIGSALLCILLSVLGSQAVLSGIVLHAVRGLLLDPADRQGQR
jgi:hypothetical protein